MLASGGLLIAATRTNAPALLSKKGPKTIADRLVQYGPQARQRLQPRFKEIAVPYPPKRLTLVGLKQEQVLEVWVSRDSKAPMQWLKTYPIQAASGQLGPKLRQGDGQVPEGLYKIESLNPNSRFHLSLRVNYPNEFDREKGRADGRANLGSDIMIHGDAVSIGCLAMGDSAAEDLFVLAADTGLKNMDVILSPIDFRTHALPRPMPPVPAWTSELYPRIQAALAPLQRIQASPTNRPPSSKAPAKAPVKKS
jgi:hypothetical protein